MVTTLASFSESFRATDVALPSVLRTTQKFSNLSMTAITKIGLTYLARYEVLNQEIYLQSLIRKFEFVDDKLAAIFLKTTFKQSVRNETIFLRESDVNPNEEAQKFITTNVPDPNPLVGFRASEIYGNIKSTILKIAPLLKKPDEFAWRLDVADYTQDELNEVVFQLKARGFEISITTPQIKIEDIRRKINLSSTQYLCIAIPPQTNSIEFSAKKFSVYQIHQACWRVKEKRSFAPINQSKEYVIRGINAELAIIAKESPLASIYSIDTACLNEIDRQDLIKHLREKGYKVSVEKPYFVVEETEGRVHSVYPVLIDLTVASK